RCQPGRAGLVSVSGGDRIVPSLRPGETYLDSELFVGRQPARETKRRHEKPGHVRGDREREFLGCSGTRYGRFKRPRHAKADLCLDQTKSGSALFAAKAAQQRWGVFLRFHSKFLSRICAALSRSSPAAAAEACSVPDCHAANHCRFCRQNTCAPGRARTVVRRNGRPAQLHYERRQAYFDWTERSGCGEAGAFGFIYEIARPAVSGGGGEGL